ncbi:sulfite reductase [NADPH] flavoprotein alpha-component, partial [Staphylococcus simulans]
SIASSNQVNPYSVDITVRVVKYESHRRERQGVCSGQLADRTQIGDKIPVYLKKNPNFKFPYNNHTPVIMIGAGTGIAPYRAFLQEREHLQLKGNQWLIFGNQNYDADFLYRSDLESWLEKGVISKLDLA